MGGAATSTACKAPATERHATTATADEAPDQRKENEAAHNAANDGWPSSTSEGC